MAKEFEKVINVFHGGIIRDDKSRIIGAAGNVEEVDIFENKDFIRAAQVNSADTMPASTEVYAYTAGDDDTMYGVGRATDVTAGRARIVSVASGGTDDPGAFTTLFTSTDTTNLVTTVVDAKFFRSTESSNATSLYYTKGTGTSWYLVRYNIGAAAEQVWNGTTWAAATPGANAQLTGLTGTSDRPTMKVIFGDLFICHNRFIAKVARDATFTEQAFTLPQEWEAVDIEAVGDAAIILCRNRARLANHSRGYWWDLTKTQQFEDQFDIPMGGPLWVKDAKENIIIACSINGAFRPFRLSSAAKGAVPLELPGIELSSMRADASLRPISMPKMVSTKERILYFGLNKTDKTGIYGLGQLDSDKPLALYLAKRFVPSGTSDYANHQPTALHIQGPNFYNAYFDGTNNLNSRCETNNTPNRSSDAVYETIWLDINEPFKDKNFQQIVVSTYPLSASTTLTMAFAVDYSTTFTTMNRASGSALNTTDALIGKFPITNGNNKKVGKIRASFTSSTSNSPRITSIGISGIIKDEIAAL